MFPFYGPCWLLTCRFTGRLRNTDDCAAAVSRILCLSEGVQIKKRALGRAMKQQRLLTHRNMLKWMS